MDKRPIDHSIKGGIDGQILVDNWSKYFLWTTNFKVLRNYLGEAVTYQFFLKTYLIIFFIVLTPFSIGGEVLLAFFLEPIYR